MAGGTRGRPAKPLESKRRTGRSQGRDAGGRKLPEPTNVVALPGAGDRIPPAPPELLTKDHAPDCGDNPLEKDPCPVCLDEPGRRLWEQLWTEGKAWLSTGVDGQLLLAQICSGRAEEAHHLARLKADGHYVRGQRGGVVRHPAVSMLRGVRAEMVRTASLCGFTPSDRSRLGLGEVKREPTPLEALLARKAAGRQSS